LCHQYNKRISVYTTCKMSIHKTKREFLYTNILLGYSNFLGTAVIKDKINFLQVRIITVKTLRLNKRAQTQRSIIWTIIVDHRHHNSFYFNQDLARHWIKYNFSFSVVVCETTHNYLSSTKNHFKCSLIILLLPSFFVVKIIRNDKL